MKLCLELVYLVCAVVIVSSLLTNDLCSFRQSSNFQPDEVHFIDIPNNCTSGQIIWSYPTGFLRIRLSVPNRSFNFCITERYAFLTGHIIEFTGGVSRPISKPTSEAPACSQSVD
ncbi:hypothetical protein Btru_042331 [Bulinus truncatus]|nr:hypothetical protein Btru_042331 [Bulinus truncatus]